MAAFLALLATLVTVVVMPTTDPGIKIKNVEENSITLQAFQKNSDKAELYARGFCNKKGKQSKLTEKSQNFKFTPSLNNYQYDCVSQSTEEETTITPSSEEISAVTTVEEVLEPETVTSSDCPSNVFVGQQQADGSWETVCKE